MLNVIKAGRNCKPKQEKKFVDKSWGYSNYAANGDNAV